MRRLNELFNYEAPEDRGAGGAAPGEESVSPAPETPQFQVSQEEWTQAQEQIKQLTGIVPTVKQMAQYFEAANEPEDDPEDFDIDRYIQSQIDSRLAPIMPVVSNAAQRSGEERMKTIFAELKKGKDGQPGIGDFDEKLAERAAHGFFVETGDPVKAVEEGARYAAEVRKSERDAGREEYKASFRRGPHDQDPDVTGGGNKSIPAAKTYDEVIERYAGETEV